MRVLLVLTVAALFGAVALADPSLELDAVSGASYTYEQYLKDFGKSHTTARAALSHKKIFQRNVKQIIAHNSRKPAPSWRAGVNKFTDMSDAERRRFLGTRVTTPAALFGERRLAELPAINVEDIPASQDWRNVNPPIITPVKDQGSCGSCWAHGSAESIESYVAMATGQLLTLSRQNLVDCAPNPNDCGGTGGCGGSTAELAFSYVSTAGGIATESEYPYHARNQACNTNVPKAATVGSWVVLPNNNYTALMQAVGTIGPMAINADASNWFMYSSGVFDGCDQSNIDINHVIQLVGYGHDSSANQDYWLVRNSWSANWGEDGYIRIQRFSDGDGHCGPDTKPQDGVGCNGGPSTVTVCGSCGIWYDTSYPTGATTIGPAERL